jgi:hypothetical protein
MSTAFKVVPSVSAKSKETDSCGLDENSKIMSPKSANSAKFGFEDVIFVYDLTYFLTHFFSQTKVTMK